MTKKNILLLNAEGVQTICLSKSLRRQGHKVVGFCNHKMSSGFVTRWLSERHKIPDITSDSYKFKEVLFTYLSNNRIDLIIPLADDGAEFLSRHKNEIENCYNTKCAVPTYKIFNLANDKQKLMELCEQYGIDHPRTRPLPYYNIESFKDCIAEISDYVSFPAIIKPNLSQGAKGIIRVESLAELEEKYPAINKQFGSCTLQEYVVQPDYYYNVMLYRDRNGKMDNYTIIKIRRFFPLKGGSSCYSETVEHEKLLGQCRDVLEKLDWVGFADFDVLEDKNTGDLKIIEINPRIPSSFQAAFAGGVDFSQVFLADEFYEDSPSFCYKIDKQVRWFGLDIMWFIFSPERFKFKPSWFKFFGKNISYYDGAWNDPMPFITGILAGIIKYLNPDFRKSKLNS